MAIDGIAALAWIDLETSGTQDEGEDVIIEFAMMVTRPDLTPVPRPEGLVARFREDVDYDDDWWYQSVVRFDRDSGERERVISRIMTGDEPVRNMHSANGLLDELSRGVGKPLGLIDQEAATILKAISKPRKSVMIAGSGVGHFDRRFIRRFMPQLEARLWYPPFDIGVFRRMCQAWGIGLLNFQETKTHRALDDVRSHIAEANYYKGVLETSFSVARAHGSQE